MGQRSELDPCLSEDLLTLPADGERRPNIFDGHRGSLNFRSLVDSCLGLARGSASDDIDANSTRCGPASGRLRVVRGYRADPVVDGVVIPRLDGCWRVVGLLNHSLPALANADEPRRAQRTGARSGFSPAGPRP